jgi:hypothetical protein
MPKGVPLDPALTIPPGPDSDGRLQALTGAALNGDVAAARQRALYLLDLFDDARFAGDGESRALLYAALGRSGTPPRGPSETRDEATVIEHELEAAHAAEGAAAIQDADLSDAITLIIADAEPPRDRGEFAVDMQAAREVLAHGSDFSPNAALRVYETCAQSLRDAADAPEGKGADIANTCLLSLYDDDPSAYFSNDPSVRPPDPPWRLLLADAIARLDKGGSAPGRLAPVCKDLAQASSQIADAVAPHLTEPDEDEIATLPAVGALTGHAGLRPYMEEPLARIDAAGGFDIGSAHVDGSDATTTAVLAGEIAKDSSGRICLLAPASTPSSTVLLFARAVVAAGGGVLELGVASPAQNPPPPGFWSYHPSKVRLAVMPFSLTPLGAHPMGRVAGSAPLVTGFDPARTQLGLTLWVDSSGGIELDSPRGHLASIPRGASADKTLRTNLGRVAGAYPDEGAIAYGADDGVPIATLASAAVTAATDADGHDLFPGKALAGSGPSSAAGTVDLNGILTTMAGLGIHVSGDAPLAQPLQSQTDAFRRCYLDALARGDVPWPVDLIITGPGIGAATPHGTDDPLARCVIGKASTLEAPSGVTWHATVTPTFAPGTAPPSYPPPASAPAARRRGH